MFGKLIKLLAAGFVCLGTATFAQTADNAVPAIAFAGASVAHPNEFPWMVRLQTGSDARYQYSGGKCGGVLIAKSWVVTAAHCITDDTKRARPQVTMFFGDHDSTKPEIGEQVRTSETYFIHQNYDRGSLRDDVALIWLSKPIKITAKVAPISIRTVPAPGTLVTMSGWGKARFEAAVGTAPTARFLKKAVVPIYDQADCGIEGITFICAGSGAVSHCSGDSGGPIVSFDDGKYHLVGIVTGARGPGAARCGAPRRITFQTRLDLYQPWIKTITQLDVNMSTNKYQYWISNVSGLALDVYDGKPRIGQNVVQAPKNAKQTWLLEPAEGRPGFYYVKTRLGDVYLDVYNGIEKNGASVVVAAKHPRQKWSFHRHKKRRNCFFIRSDVNGRMLDVFRGRSSVGANVVVADPHPKQFWCLTPL